MAKFEVPALEVITFDVEDIITTSSDFIPPETSENQTPYG